MAALAELAPKGMTSLLDVGAGDGQLGRAVAHALDLRTYVALDPLPRGDNRHEIRQLDPRAPHLPFNDGAFDLVLLADVLHHASDPAALLKACLRVARVAVLVKDHVARTRFDHAVLSLLDIVGNAPYGAPWRAHYFGPNDLVRLAVDADAKIKAMTWPLAIHPALVQLVARPELQFVARLEPGT